MRRQLFLHKTRFPSYFIDCLVFFRIYTFYIMFNNLFLNWLSTKTQKLRALIWEKLHHCREQKCDEHGASFQSLPIENKLHAQDNTHLYTMKVYYTQPVSLTIEDSSFFSTTEVFACCKVINDRICGPTHSRKDLHLSHQSVLSSLSKICMAPVMPQFVSLVSIARKAWDPEPLLARTHERKKKRLHF